MPRQPAPPIHVRDDEEQDITWVSVMSAGKVCRFCGHDDHDFVACPYRPD